MNGHPLIALLVVLLCVYSPINASSFVDKRQTSAYQPGHVIFGGLFPAHMSWRENCADVNLKGIALIEAMIYTINKVNGAESLLPWNLTLGFDIRDTCNVEEIALKNTLEFLSGERYTSINDNPNKCGGGKTTLCDGKLISVIGAGNTELSVAVNKVLSVFNIPQIGYASTSGILSDKSRFPSFSRTVVVGSQRPKVIAKVLEHFGWKYIALLVTNDLYWKSLSLEFKNLANENDICIEIDEIILEGSRKVKSIVHQLNKTESLQIIILFASPFDTTNIIKQASVIGLTGKVWIYTELLSPDVATEYAHILKGMLVIEREPESVNEFAKYFASLTPTENTWNPWFRNLWEDIFGCRFPNDNRTNQETSTSMQKVCKGTEQFGWVRQVLSFSNTLHVIDAVMAVTQVINNICQESTFKSFNMSEGQEQCLQKLTKANILSKMFKGPFVFQSLFNRTVSLDKNGNAMSSYIVFNLKEDKNGVQFHKVGTYKTPNDNLNISNDNIQWTKDYELEPRETWGTPCNAGSYTEAFKGSRCRWQCKPCADGSISKEINAAICVKCPAGTKPNQLKTLCTTKFPEFFSWGSSGGGTLTAISMISFFLCVIIFCIFVRYKKSAVVSGWGSDVNFYLLWSIAVGVLVPFAFIGYPTDIMCKIQAIFVGTTLTFSITLVLVKIKQITCKKKHMVSSWQVLSYAQKQTIFSLFLTIVELFFCVLWVIISPPEASIRDISGSKIIMCTNVNSSWYVLLSVYIFSITIMITLRSCKARDRSFNFSEARFILFAMFTIYAIWGVYLGVSFMTSVGLNHITLLCLTTIATQVVLLGFIFAPKVFILFWRPEMGKNCEFQTDTLDGKVQMRYETTNARYLNPNGHLRSGSPPDRDNSSRGSPSQVSLELPGSRPQSRPQSPVLDNRRSIINQIFSQLPCCAGITRDDDPTPSFTPPEQFHSNPPQRRLPLIMIDEATRSNSARSQISDRTAQFSSRIEHHVHPMTIRQSSVDHEQELVSATMDDDTAEVWNKRRQGPDHDNNVKKSREFNNRLVQRGVELDAMSQDEYCLRFTLNGKVVEGRNSRSQPIKDVKIRESTL